MNLKITFFFGILLLLCNNSFAQNTSSPTFESFKGTVYKMPAKVVVKGYRTGMYNRGIYDYEKITEVELPALDIAERADSILFPGLTVKNRFGMVLHSTMSIPKSGWYEFSLSSDDGSILWIDDKLIINNDGVHKMRLKRDTIQYNKGTYPVKVWYFQGVPDRYGIELSAVYVHKEIIITEEKPSPTIILSEKELQFATNSARISATGNQSIVELTLKLRGNKIQKISIIGHTDDKGSAAYNKILSLDRAKAVQRVLSAKLEDKNIQFVTKGMGESSPISSNDTAEGRSQNRRVVIQIEYQ